MTEELLNIMNFGAVGDGISDDTSAFQTAINSAKEKGIPLYIPVGVYVISEALKIPSDFTINASKCAKIVLDGKRKKHRDDYLLTNADTENGNVNITITGGIWDGNNQGEGNQKPDIFDKNGYSGTVLNFCNVKGLHLSDLVVANSVTYNIRMAKINGFTIENISFVSDNYGVNQDGLHFNGEVRHGKVKNIRALSYGQTNDDLIALNADDSMERVENFGMVRGDIEDIDFEDLFAENCHTVIRILSTTAAIRNIRIKNVYGGYRCFAVNADGARYCRTPLFKEEEFPKGCGKIENFVIENMTCFPTSDMGNPAICIESLCDGFEIKNFRFDGKGKNALQVRNVTDTVVMADGKETVIDGKDKALILENFENLKIQHK